MSSVFVQNQSLAKAQFERAMANTRRVLAMQSQQQHQHQPYHSNYGRWQKFAPTPLACTPPYSECTNSENSETIEVEDASDDELQKIVSEAQTSLAAEANERSDCPTPPMYFKSVVEAKACRIVNSEIVYRTKKEQKRIRCLARWFKSTRPDKRRPKFHIGPNDLEMLAQLARKEMRAMDEAARRRRITAGKRF